MLPIGFGSAEEEAAKEIIDRCITAVKNNKSVEDIAVRYRALAKKYDSMQYPECPQRYTEFWVYYEKFYDGMFIELNMHHVNRNHPISPDRWAMCKTKWIIRVYENGDEPGIFREV